jgi:hypothetical protein
MKLTLNRREEQEGIFKKSPVYYLDLNLEVTPEEMALIKKHKWDQMLLFEGRFKSGAIQEWPVGHIVGKPNSFPFAAVGDLAHVESQLIANAKKLKQQLEAAEGFTAGGPREIEL